MRIELLIGALNFASVIALDYLEARIVNGNITSIQKHPHAVFLGIDVGFYGIVMCGGSIVNQRVILTAAHCLEEARRGRVFTSVGSSHYRNGRIIKVTSTRPHPQYDKVKITNDIALVGLEHPVVFGENAQRIAIAKAKPSKGMAILAGWGAVQEFPIYSYTEHLREVSVPFMVRKECRKNYKLKVQSGAFCGGLWRSMSHPSQGDSGSALVMNNYLQIGIVSYKMNQISRSMVVYTDVPYYYDWIQKNAKTLFCDKQWHKLSN